MSLAPQRTFGPDDPGVPKNGLLVGGGGGFTHVYVDYVLHSENGKVEKISYMASGGAIPRDYEVVATGFGNPKDVVDFMAKLTANEFWTLKPEGVSSDAFDYIAANNNKKGANYFLWVKDSSGETEETIWRIRSVILDYAKKIVEG